MDFGYFGEVRLDGLCFALIYAWPGAIFQGNGEMQAIIDHRASPLQRDALSKILHGGETETAATHWWVFHAMSSRVHETLFKPIAFEVDVERRTAHAQIPDLLEASGEPIRGPVTGEPHRIRIDLPAGIEFDIAEIGKGSTRSSGAVPLRLTSTYGQFNRFRLSGKGIVRKAKLLEG